MNTEKQIIEINGIKMEIDLRQAKVIENYKIGDNIRLLVRQYDNEYKVFPGVIVSFDAFENLPTIVVAYLEIGYNEAKIEFAYINRQTSKDSGAKYEIAPANYIDETHFKKATVLESMDSKITKLQEEIKEIERKREYFLVHFSKYFADFSKEAV